MKIEKIPTVKKELTLSEVNKMGLGLYRVLDLSPQDLHLRDIDIFHEKFMIIQSQTELEKRFRETKLIWTTKLLNKLCPKRILNGYLDNWRTIGYKDKNSTGYKVLKGIFYEEGIPDLFCFSNICNTYLHIIDHFSLFYLTDKNVMLKHKDKNLNKLLKTNRLTNTSTSPIGVYWEDILGNKNRNFIYRYPSDELVTIMLQIDEISTYYLYHLITPEYFTEDTQTDSDGTKTYSWNLNSKTKRLFLTCFVLGMYDVLGDFVFTQKKSKHNMFEKLTQHELGLIKKWKYHFRKVVKQFEPDVVSTVVFGDMTDKNLNKFNNTKLEFGLGDLTREHVVDISYDKVLVGKINPEELKKDNYLKTIIN